jgi:hypothetical protein
LRPGGHVALIWNERDSADPFTSEYGRIAESLQHSQASTAMRGAYRTYVPPLLAAAGFANIRERTFANVQRLDLDGLLGRARSASYVPREGPGYEHIAADLRALYGRFADRSGTVALAHTTHVFTAETPAP